MNRSSHKAAYFAGIIDGEGCIYVRHRKYPDGRPAWSVLRVVVDMTCEKTIRALHDYFGGSVMPKRPRLAHYKPQFRWEVSDAKARRVLLEIRPYLITKADHADVCYVESLPKRACHRKIFPETLSLAA